MAEAEFPSNSHRDRSADPNNKVGPAKKQAETKKVERIITGEVLQRKKPLRKRFREAFLGGDTKSVWTYVTMDVIIPAARDLVADAARETIERVIFPDGGRSRSRSYPGGSNGRTPYGSAFRGNGATRNAEYRPADTRDVSARGRAMHDFNEIILQSRGEAEQVIDTLNEIVAKYDVASVADLYEMVGISSKYTDQKYGWTDLRGARAVHVRGGSYLLELPRPEPLS